jgi:hypothetical protein
VSEGDLAIQINEQRALEALQQFAPPWSLRGLSGWSQPEI